MQGHQRLMSHSKEFWQNMVHWRRKWQTTPVFLPQEPHEACEKGSLRTGCLRLGPGHKMQNIKYSSKHGVSPVPRQVSHLPCCSCDPPGRATATWTVACQTSPSMEFSRQEYWSGLPFPSLNQLSGGQTYE